jgi:AcrR family transcriptional regulator
MAARLLSSFRKIGYSALPDSGQVRSVSPKRTQERTQTVKTGANAGAKARLGRREFNKNDKLRRIKEAAREYFRTRDFDRATTREIAERAGVALGTLFTYATDKRDLLFLAVNEDLDDIVRKATEDNRPDAPLVDNFLAVFGLFYRYYAQQPHLARLILREMIFYESGEQARLFLASRARLIALCEQIVRQAVGRGEIKSDEAPEFIGWLVFSVYGAEVRRWLWIGKPNLRAGMARLRRALELFTSGLKSRPV